MVAIPCGFESHFRHHVGAKSALLRRLFCFWQMHLPQKAAVAPLPCSSFSAKGPARLACSLASALTTARCRYQPFAAAAPCGAGDGPGRTRRTEKTRRRSRQYGVRPSEKPPRRRIVRFAPTSFCACGKKDVIRLFSSFFFSTRNHRRLIMVSLINAFLYLFVMLPKLI